MVIAMTLEAQMRAIREDEDVLANARSLSHETCLAQVTGSPPRDVLPPRMLIRAPLTPPIRPPRTIAVIETEIRRATIAGFRAEDV